MTPSDDIGKKSARAGVLTLLAQAGKFAISLGTVTILARVLVPADFGIVAIAVSCLAVATLLREGGLAMASVQADELTDDQASGLFWCQLALGLIVAAALSTVIPILVWVFDEPRLSAALPWIVATLVLNAIGAQHEGMLKRRIRFGTLNLIEFASLAAGLGVAIAAALRGYGFHALLVQHVVTAAVKSGMLWWLGDWRPSGPRTIAAARPFFRYGKDVTWYRFANAVGSQLDQVLVGALHGANAVGIYSTATRYGNMPVQQVYPSLLSVAVAGFSRVRTDVDRYRQFFRSGVTPLAAALVPTLAFLVVAADEVILVLLGDQWGEAVPLFRILLVAAGASSVTRITKWIFMAEGRTGTMRRIGLLSNLLLVVAITIGALISTFATAVAVALANLALVGPIVMACVRDSAIRVTDFRQVFLPPLVTSMIAALTVAASAPWLDSSPGWLVIAGFEFTLAYFALWFTFPSGRQALATIWLRSSRMLRQQRTP